MSAESEIKIIIIIGWWIRHAIIYQCPLSPAFYPDADSNLESAFSKLADAMSEDFRFAYTSDGAVLEKYGYRKWAEWLFTARCCLFVHVNMPKELG